MENYKCNKSCDCCNVIIGYSEYTIISEHDTQLSICEDCLPVEEVF